PPPRPARRHPRRRRPRRSDAATPPGPLCPVLGGGLAWVSPSPSMKEHTMGPNLTRRTVLGGATAATALGLAGCLQNPDEGGGSGGGGSDGGGGSAGGAAGDGVVTILGNFGGVEADGFNAALAAFTEE